MTLSARTTELWHNAAVSGGSPAAPSVPMPEFINAVVVSVHDGDTFGVVADLGNGDYAGSTEHPQSIRLLGCNAAELKTPGGDAAAANLRALLPAGTRVVLSRRADDRYPPRWDAAVTFLLDETPVDLTTHLLDQQWVAPWTGAASKPTPPWPRTVA
jgi:endonuclease YncB( thermonuclease family)